MDEESDILSEYESTRDARARFLSAVTRLIRRLLETNKIKIHSVTSRLKKKESLRGKLSSKKGRYGSLSDVTDICAVRIVTFYPDHVDDVATIIGREFSVDHKNSVDKRVALDPDRFGYLSLHFVVSFSEARCNLPEYRSFRGEKVEIQIRSILQHAWAEIEHDLGYKTKNAIPRDTRRRFSRLAGLLELVDGEFEAIRKHLGNYERTIDRLLRDTPAEVSIDQTSLRSLITSDSAIKRMDEDLAETAGVALEAPQESFIGDLIEELSAVDLSTVSDVQRAHAEEKRAIRKIGSELFSAERFKTLSRGSTLALLIYVVLSRARREKEIVSHLNQYGCPSRYSPERFAKLVLNAVEE